jgi:hypothetical protein
MSAALFVGPVFELVKQLLSGLGLDPEAKERAQRQAFDLLTQGDYAQRSGLSLALAQLEVNKAEASSPGVFRGGWRPYIGWTCGVALSVQYVVGPLVQWGAAIAGHALPPLPSLDGVLWELMFALLGLGALRTVERVKGKA